MSEPTAFGFTKVFSDLTGRSVNVSETDSRATGSDTSVFVVYRVRSNDRPIVMRMDLDLLAQIAGSIIGLPPNLAIEKARSVPMADVMLDAMHEIANVLSSEITSEPRVLLQGLCTSAAQCDSDVRDVVRKPGLASAFKVVLAGKPAGMFSILKQW